MSLVAGLTSLVRVLETYRGRDRVIGLASYVGMFFGGDGRTPAQVKWKKVSAEMSACRVILRMFDDLPMLLHNMSTGFGLKAHGILRPLEVIVGLLNQLYFPIEHVAWLRQKQILDGSSALWSLLGLVFWALSLFGEILKCLVKISNLRAQACRLNKQQLLDTDGSGHDSPQNIEIRENLKKLSSEHNNLLLLFLQYSADFVNAVSWLPPGILWAQKLRSSTNGVLGVVSTSIMLYRNWPSHVKT